MKKIITIKATVCYEQKYWSVIFELLDDKQISIARKIFHSEPSDPEIYEYVKTQLTNITFTEPREFALQLKRKNPKRIQREIKREMAKLSQTTKTESYAQEIVRLEIEKNKITKKKDRKDKREKEKEAKFILKQRKKKEKHKGH